MRLDVGARGQREKLAAVGARQVCHGADAALTPEDLVGETRDVAHVDPAADDDASRAHGAQRRRHERADRGEDDRRIERLRREVLRAPGPDRAELARGALRRLVARPRERVDLASLPADDLGQDVRRRAEAVEADPLRLAAHPQRAIADQPGAQERRRLLIGLLARQGEAEALVGDHVLGIPAVDVAAGKAGAHAEVLAPRQALIALATGPAEPGHADPSTVGHRARDDLVSEDPRRLRDLHLAIDEVEVRAAHGAGVDAQQQLTGPGDRDRPRHRHERRADALEDHRTHARPARCHP